VRQSGTVPYASLEDKRRYQREWRAKRRAEFFEGKTCVSCGSSEDLELHHRDKTEKVSHKIWSWSLERREAELAKCDVKCGSCHDEEHAAERRAPCGTAAAYTRGCRCPACRRAHRDAARLWRAAHCAPLSPPLSSVA